MIRNQITGYEAEVWSLDIQLGKESMVAAGALEQCKTYMSMLLQQNTADMHYFIITETNRIIWDPEAGNWVTLIISAESQ